MKRAATVLLLLVAACGGEPGDGATTLAGAANPASTVTTSGAQGPLRGFSLSPPNYEADGFTEFFEVAVPHADIVERVVDILEWEEGPDSGIAVIDSLADRYGFIPVAVTGVFDVATGDLLRPIDGATFDRYVAAARGYAERTEPRYLGLGVEIDTQWREHPDEFEQFVDLFAAVAAAVREVSPRTRIFTAFQLERFSGMQGGLFGGENDPELAAWDLIDRFPDADIIAFTTYPGLVFTDPADIPDDYYSRLNDAAGGRPIAFTEMGWQAGGDFAEYSGSEEKQAAFVARFRELIAGAEVEFYVWSFLYDQPAPVAFQEMGLIDSAGRERLAWEVWKAG